MCDDFFKDGERPRSTNWPLSYSIHPGIADWVGSCPLHPRHLLLDTKQPSLWVLRSQETILVYERSNKKWNILPIIPHTYSQSVDSSSHPLMKRLFKLSTTTLNFILFTENDMNIYCMKWKPWIDLRCKRICLESYKSTWRIKSLSLLLSKQTNYHQYRKYIGFASKTWMCLCECIHSVDHVAIDCC